jgi:uncharacterized linocin/CFP29 family protein
MMETKLNPIHFRVVQIQTKASADIVVRNAMGRKLFDMNIPGVSVTVAVPLDAEIEVLPVEPPRMAEANNMSDSSVEVGDDE